MLCLSWYLKWKVKVMSLKALFFWLLWFLTVANIPIIFFKEEESWILQELLLIQIFIKTLCKLYIDWLDVSYSLNTGYLLYWTVPHSKWIFRFFKFICFFRHNKLYVDLIYANQLGNFWTANIYCENEACSCNLRRSVIQEKWIALHECTVLSGEFLKLHCLLAAFFNSEKPFISFQESYRRCVMASKIEALQYLYFQINQFFLCDSRLMKFFQKLNHAAERRAVVLLFKFPCHENGDDCQFD